MQGAKTFCLQNAKSQEQGDYLFGFKYILEIFRVAKAAVARRFHGPCSFSLIFKNCVTLNCDKNERNIGASIR